MKKAVKTVSIVLLFVILIALIVGWILFGERLTAACSVKKLEEGLYAMEFIGDYGFADFLEKGGAASAEELADYLTSYLSMGTVQPETTAPDFGCSALTVSTPVGVLFGRNYDWESCTAMLVHTLPKDGYESVSTTCPDFLGFGADWIPDGDITSRMMALAAVYIPLDGMNEMGLCVADLMAGDDEETHQQSHRPDLTTTTALRLLLDRAATVDEALNLLSQYDMNSDIGTAHHFAIADASGRSVAVEYIEGKMIVTEAPILTNHYLARGKQDVGSRSSHFRFDTLTSLYPDVQNADALLAAMKGVAQSRDPFADEYEATQWTLVFDTKQKTARFYRNERFGKPYHLSLGQKNWLDCLK